MRILVELPKEHVRILDRLASQGNISRAALIRAAVAGLIDKRRDAPEGLAFGLSASRRDDGLTYQEKLRTEW